MVQISYFFLSSDRPNRLHQWPQPLHQAAGHLVLGHTETAQKNKMFLFDLKNEVPLQEKFISGKSSQMNND